MPIELQTNISLETQPTDPKHLVSMGWVEEFVAGKVKAPVRVVATTDQDGTYDPDPAQLTLTYTAMGVTVIDGVTLAVGDRVLLVGQDDETQNGIYVLHTLGDPSTHAVLARASDFNASDQIFSGVMVNVGSEGDDHGNTSWRLATGGTIVLDSTALEFILGTPPTGTKKYAETITGDDTNTEFDVQHNLATTDVQVQIFNTTSKSMVLADVEVTDANTVTIGFGEAPAPSQVYRVVCIG